MTEHPSETRWWENYLVRYLLPSIIGMLIVVWLQHNTAASRYIPCFLPLYWKNFNMASLILWFLLGSLYCYFASYPALVFHATRSLDFKDARGTPTSLLYNPYTYSILFSVLAMIAALLNLLSPWIGIVSSIILVLFFSGVQCWRICRIFFHSFGHYGSSEDFDNQHEATIAYAYLRKLALRRGNADQGTYQAAVDKDIMDSYKHLREHGNTALIVMLEIALCPIFFILFQYPRRGLSDFLLAVVLTLWVLPSVLIHGLAQQLEHRFSGFEFPFNRR